MKSINSQLTPALLVLLAVCGCSVNGRHSCFRDIAEKNLIFNPDWTRLPVFDVAREDWPFTSSVWHNGETTEYRETIIDRQGRFLYHPECHYYRRFDSIRTGRLHR